MSECVNQRPICDQGDNGEYGFQGENYRVEGNSQHSVIVGMLGIDNSLKKCHLRGYTHSPDELR